MIHIRTAVAPFVACAAAALAAALAAAHCAAQGPLPPTAPRIDVIWDVQYAGDSRRNCLDLFVPKGAPSPPPVVMFVHGGAWTLGSKEHGEGLARALAARGIACASINTRQHPFAKPDEMVEDCGKALAWLHTHAAEHGCDGERLFVMGHSSGAHLVTWLALDATKLAAAGVPRAAVRGVIALSGVYETRTRHQALDKVFGNDAVARSLASPLVHVGAGDPPCFLVWGDHDLPGLSSCARMLRDRLTDAGVPVVCRELRGRNHIDYFFGLGGAGDTLLDDVAAFIARPPSAALAATPPRERTTLAWVVATDAEREAAKALAKALEPHAIAVVPVDAATPAAVATAWRQLRPAAAFLGGSARGGFLAAAARLGTADGLRGRIVAGAPLLARSLADAWPGAAAADLAHLGGANAPSLLILQAENDPQPQRDDALQVGNLLLGQHVAVEPVELAATTTADALAGAGRTGDLVAPLVRAFVRP